MTGRREETAAPAPADGVDQDQPRSDRDGVDQDQPRSDRDGVGADPPVPSPLPEVPPLPGIVHEAPSRPGAIPPQPQPAPSVALALREVTKEYPGGVLALRAVSVEVGVGEQVAVVGPSGSGKTTLLTVLGTLERPTSGSVVVAGRDVVGLTDGELAGLRAHEIGFVFQGFHLQESMTALDNVANGMLYTGSPARERRRAARAALERVGLEHRVTHRPTELSGGERQRVAIARAIAKRPLIILADEPTGNLDSTSGREVISLLHELAAEGATLTLITHDAAISGRFPRHIQMRDGEVVGDERT